MRPNRTRKFLSHPIWISRAIRACDARNERVFIHDPHRLFPRLVFGSDIPPREHLGRLDVAFFSSKTIQDVGKILGYGACLRDWVVRQNLAIDGEAVADQLQ